MPIWATGKEGESVPVQGTLPGAGGDWFDVTRCQGKWSHLEAPDSVPCQDCFPHFCLVHHAVTIRTPGPALLQTHCRLDFPLSATAQRQEEVRRSRETGIKMQTAARGRKGEDALHHFRSWLPAGPFPNPEGLRIRVSQN